MTSFFLIKRKAILIFMSFAIASSFSWAGVDDLLKIRFDENTPEKLHNLEEAISTNLRSKGSSTELLQIFDKWAEGLSAAQSMGMQTQNIWMDVERFCTQLLKETDLSTPLGSIFKSQVAGVLVRANLALANLDPNKASKLMLLNHARSAYQPILELFSHFEPDTLQEEHLETSSELIRNEDFIKTKLPNYYIQLGDASYELAKVLIRLTKNKLSETYVLPTLFVANKCYSQAYRTNTLAMVSKEKIGASLLGTILLTSDAYYLASNVDFDAIAECYDEVLELDQSSSEVRSISSNLRKLIEDWLIELENETLDFSRPALALHPLWDQERLIQLASKHDAKLATLSMQEGDKQFNQGNYTLAKAEYEKALQKINNQNKILFQEDMKKFLRHDIQICEKRQTASEFYLSGINYAEAGNLNDAIHFLNAALNTKTQQGNCVLPPQRYLMIESLAKSLKDRF